MRTRIGLVLLVFLAACNSGPESKAPSDTKHVSISSLKLSLDYPTSWNYTFDRDSNQANALMTFQSPMDSNDVYQENLSVYHEVLPMRLEDSIYHLASIREIILQNQNRLQVHNVGRKQFGDNQFNEFYFTFNHQQTDYIVHGYTFLKDSVGFNFHYTATLAQEKHYLPVIHQILGSFKPL